MNGSAFYARDVNYQVAVQFLPFKSAINVFADSASDMPGLKLGYVIKRKGTDLENNEAINNFEMLPSLRADNLKL